jgi:SAM-dependent methyltransferase
MKRFLRQVRRAARRAAKETDQLLNRLLPRRWLIVFTYARYAASRSLREWRLAGGTYNCPVCENSVVEFTIIGGTAWCPICWAAERHRVDWVFLREHTGLLDRVPKRLLHVAPELPMTARFRSVPNISYLSADIANPWAMERMDITDIAHPDDHFDVIYCSHVLEHIEDDRRALRELYRVCRPGGWGLLQVPIAGERTFEDASITGAEREAVFGQADHVRTPGLDYADRMREAGFDVECVATSDFLPSISLDAMGILQRPRYIFHCRKR